MIFTLGSENEKVRGGSDEKDFKRVELDLDRLKYI